MGYRRYLGSEGGKGWFGNCCLDCVCPLLPEVVALELVAHPWFFGAWSKRWELAAGIICFFWCC